MHASDSPPTERRPSSAAGEERQRSDAVVALHNTVLFFSTRIAVGEINIVFKPRLIDDLHRSRVGRIGSLSNDLSAVIERG